MAIQRDFTYEQAGNLLMTGAYHKISRIDLEVVHRTLTTGEDQDGGGDPKESDAEISYDIFANSGVRYDIATPLEGGRVKWPLSSWSGVSGYDSLIDSAYEFLKTGELSGGIDV